VSPHMQFRRIITIALGIFFIGVCLLFVGEVYAPKSASGKQTVYTVEKGMSSSTIARDLETQGIIKSAYFFKIYIVVSGQRAKLQAGRYTVSPSMSIFQIVKEMVSGNSINDRVTIVEGWDTKDVGSYLQAKGFYSEQDFLSATQKDWSQEFSFLADKPKNLDVEGYLFPDTYQIYPGESTDTFVESTLLNFNQKITPDLRKEIAAQHKSIFQIITMASILEKEANNLQDKKIVSGILWKRMANNIPLQVDSTVNFATGKNDASVSQQDTLINSPYNTYKYLGLPLGPISNPGMDSILAAINPQQSDYWYYLSDSKGNIIYSKTLEEQSAAIQKYLHP